MQSPSPYWDSLLLLPTEQHVLVRMPMADFLISVLLLELMMVKGLRVGIENLLSCRTKNLMHPSTRIVWL